MSLANARQQLIVDLFNADYEDIRNEARQQLSSSTCASDPEFIPELLQYGRDNPTMNEGLWNALYLLEKQSDAQLYSHQELVRDFLDWMSQKGYGPSTMERIGDLQGRLGG